MNKSKTYLKQKRNRQYEEMAKEFSESGLNLSEIKIEDFAESRKKEIINFHNILSTKTSSKTGHQLLPKHMRRRQMSHNPFRIPRRNRLSNLTVKIKSKCKKHKRKLKNLKNSLIRRASRQNWLESHLWLSKRFVMKKYLHTYTIPYKRRDKGLRACYKYWQYHACIHEMSYYDYFVVKCKNQKDAHIFIEKIKKGHTIDNLPNLKDNKLYRIEVYNKNKLIGPISFFIHDTVIIFSIVSIITDEINEFLNDIANGINCEVEYTHNLNCFLLFGKECLKKMYNIFKSCEKDEEKMNILNNYETFKDYFEKKEDGAIEVLKLNIPKSQFKMNELIFTSCLDSLLKNEKKDAFNDLISQTNQHITNFIDILTTSSKPRKIDENNTNDYEANKLNQTILLSNVTERTTFMHRKNVDLKALNKKLSKSVKEGKNPKLPLQFQSKNNTKYNKGQVYDSQAIKPKEVLCQNSKDTLTYISVVKLINIYDTNKVEESYMLIFERGYCIDLLRRFVYVNTKAIGLKEYERYKNQNNQLSFPKDYPGTFAYKQYILSRAKTSIGKYFKKPPSKRVNYQKIKNPSPFYPSWYYLKNKAIPSQSIDKSLSDVSIVKNPSILLSKEKIGKLFNLISYNKNLPNSNQIFILGINFCTVERGVPKYNDLICLPNEEDIQIYLNYLQNKIEIKTNLFGKNENEKLNIENINIIDNMTKNFFIQESYSKTYIKNNNINSEILSVLDYYNSNMTKQLTNRIINSDFTLKLTTPPAREIIGFVTHGLYDYNSNQGKGHGYILINQYEKIINLKRKFGLNFIPALLRKKTSLIYYLISLYE